MRYVGVSVAVNAHYSQCGNQLVDRSNTGIIEKRQQSFNMETEVQKLELTYNSRDSLVVTVATTKRPNCGLSVAKQTE